MEANLNDVAGILGWCAVAFLIWGGALSIGHLIASSRPRPDVPGRRPDAHVDADLPAAAGCPD